MAEDKRNAERLGGEYMIQDRDHMGNVGQMGGEAGGRQSQQSQAGPREYGIDQSAGTGHQGGEQSPKRSKRL